MLSDSTRTASAKALTKSAIMQITRTVPRTIIQELNSSTRSAGCASLRCFGCAGAKRGSSSIGG